MTKPHERYGPAGTYRFWSTWNSEEDDAEECKFTRDVYGSGIATILECHARNSGEAEDYVDQNHADRDHPYLVRSPDGTLREWTIRGEPSVYYSATSGPLAECHRCHAVPPAAGRHALGWRFATCSDAEPRWTCPGCRGEEGKAAAHDRAWGPPG